MHFPRFSTVNRYTESGGRRFNPRIVVRKASRSLILGAYCRGRIRYEFCSLSFLGHADSDSRRVRKCRPIGDGEDDLCLVHSGVHFYLAPPDKNHGAQAIRRELLRNGIANDDIVVLDSPFEQATLSNVLPQASVKLFMQITNPDPRPPRTCTFAWTRHSVRWGSLLERELCGSATYAGDRST